MNIEFKESFFRFIFPPCLFFATLYIYYFLDGNLFWIKFLNHQKLWVLVVFFMALSHVINSTSSLIGRCITIYYSKFYEIPWLRPETELKYWRNLSIEEEYTQKKINRRWDFYTSYMNSAVAIFLAILIYFIIFHQNMHLYFTFFLSVLIGIFCGLGEWGFKSVIYFGKEVYKKK